MSQRHVGGQYNHYKATGGKVHRECGLPWEDHVGIAPEVICPDDPRADLRSPERRARDLDPIEPYREDDDGVWGGFFREDEPTPGMAALFDDPESY